MDKFYLEHINCDFCGSGRYKTRYRKPDDWLLQSQYEFPVVECHNCGLVYLNPRPTQVTMSNFYPLNYHEDRNTESYKMRYKNQLEYLPKLTNQVILDIGCARGDYLAYIKSVAPETTVVGVDYFSTKVDYDFIQFHQKLLPDASLESEAFDLINAWAVFEHLHEPGVYFQEVNRLLKKGGKFIFLVTNSESLYGRRAYKEDIPRHTYHFSEMSLKKYAAKFGFSSTAFFYETRFWDATGHGTCYHFLLQLFGSTYEKRSLKGMNFLERSLSRIGRKLDRIVFKSNWEAKNRKSGILVAEFTK